MNAPDRTVRVVIEGRVQGVWFRGWTVENARALGLCGWVRNCADGSVAAQFSGPEGDVDTMLARCHQGPPSANVLSVTIDDCSGPVLTGFHQVR